MNQLWIIYIISTVLSIIVLILYFFFKYNRSKYLYWLYLTILLISLITLTYNLIIFDNYVSYMLFPVLHEIIISYVTYEILTKFYKKNYSGKKFKLFTLILMICYVILIIVIKQIVVQ